MANIDKTLKRIFAWAVLACILVSGLSLYLYFASQHRQAEREMIYIKARNMAAQQQRERAQQWKKRRLEQQMRRQYNQGRVVDVSQPAAQPQAPAQGAASQPTAN